MKVRNFDLVKGMQIGTKSISALLLATIMMAATAGIPATTYNESKPTSLTASRIFRASRWLRRKCHTRLVALPHRTIIRTRRSSTRTSFRVRSQAR
jgi:hypothetical protein